MEQFYPLLLRTSLFRGFDAAELHQLMGCFSPALRRFDRGEILLMAGYENRDVGILLEGEAEALKNTPEGTSVSIVHIAPGGVFGDVLSGSSQKSPVTVLARTDCTAVFLPYERILHPCRELHHCHLQLLQNLVSTISDKYFGLSHRIDLLILKSLRAKLCAYLLEMHRQTGQDTFTIPFNRAELADYLNCERSALSRELSRMQSEGLIETYRSSFRLLDPDALQRQYTQ